jgi:LuxR family maltose regulon positive regulatory protein
LSGARTHPGQADLPGAIALAGRVLDGALGSRQLPAALETLLLRSQMHAARGNERSSRQDLCQALELAETEGVVSVFLEEGPEIAVRLAGLLEGGLPLSVSPEFVRAILSAMPGGSPVGQVSGGRSAVKPPDMAVPDAGEDLGPIEALTPRELEVLRLIAAGDSNREIAAKLVITVSAVKKHSANIYARLNVNSRTQAVARARRLGLLPRDG